MSEQRGRDVVITYLCAAGPYQHTGIIEDAEAGTYAVANVIVDESKDLLGEYVLVVMDWSCIAFDIGHDSVTGASVRILRSRLLGEMVDIFALNAAGVCCTLTKVVITNVHRNWFHYTQVGNPGQHNFRFEDYKSIRFKLAN